MIKGLTTQVSRITIDALNMTLPNTKGQRERTLHKVVQRSLEVRFAPIFHRPRGPGIFNPSWGDVINREMMDIMTLMIIVTTAALVLFGACWHEYD